MLLVVAVELVVFVVNVVLVVWLGNWLAVVAVLWVMELGSEELPVVCAELVSEPSPVSMLAYERE